MSNQRKIKSLDELMDGALAERFNYEMERVLANVFDLNTSPKAKRKIQIIINITPNERRDAAEFKVEVKSTVASPIPVTQTVFLDVDDHGNVTATEITNQTPGQINIDGDETSPNVIEFKNTLVK